MSRLHKTSDGDGALVAPTYTVLVIVAGALAIADSIWGLTQTPPGPGWYVLALLTALSGAATLRMPIVPISFSISDSFTITAALLFGPGAGAVAAAIDGLVISIRLTRVGIQRVLFNTAAPAVAMWLSARAFFLLAGVGPLLHTTGSLGRLILPLGVFAGLFFVLNTALIACAIAQQQRVSPLAFWRQHFVGLWLTYFGGAAVAALLIALVRSQQQELLMFALVAPIPFILHATFRNVVGRMEDRVGHLDQVNQMHVATIETLAHAIDAKDQVTHGHIRRVQYFAVALARALDITDEAHLRAIEAAALLHDIGKLAVPEHILNKPGALTPAEYGQMKRHAAIGAEILATVNFPFPVVPIVRHHHENWDGTGYPDGLKGDAIPIGARILSVVDCFDATTSDRPYRPALPFEEAVAILRTRSGTMYEPRVVERFIEVHRVLAKHQNPGPTVEAFNTIARTVASATANAAPRLPERDVLAALFELGRDIAAAPDAVTALTSAHPTLQRLMSAATCVLYIYDRGEDALIAQVVVGDHRDLIRGLSIRRGQRLTGWVAANHQTILNSDAALDLGNLIVKLHPTPQACLSTPICAGDELLGVLTIYSNGERPFTDAHAAVAEVVASGLRDLLNPEPAGETTAPRRLEPPTSTTRVH